MINLSLPLHHRGHESAWLELSRSRSIIQNPCDREEEKPSGGVKRIVVSPAWTTVAVFRRVAALPLSVRSWAGEFVTLRHLLPAAAGYPVLAAGTRAL